MTPSQYEEYLSQLTDEQYGALIQERAARLNKEQQAIIQYREVQRKYRYQLILKACGEDATEDDHEAIYDALKDESDNCEHGRSYCKHCTACAEIDHLMFPELFDEDGERLEDPEEQLPETD
jgi:hypothetical protein